MSIPSNIPQITALREAVEKVAGTPLRTHDAFIALVGEIESALNEHISESTLERIWGYSTRGSKALSYRSLDVLARYAGAASWDDFCKRTKEESRIESEELKGDSISADNLRVGDILKIAWLPDRVITIRYNGNYRFEILESINSSLREGDTFSCLVFQKGSPLYLDRFVRSGETEEHRYVAGERSGLTSVEVVQ